MFDLRQYLKKNKYITNLYDYARKHKLCTNLSIEENRNAVIDNIINNLKTYKPLQITCPLSKKIFKDPVIIFSISSDKNTYERTELKNYFVLNSKYPGEIDSSDDDNFDSFFDYEYPKSLKSQSYMAIDLDFFMKIYIKQLLHNNPEIKEQQYKIESDVAINSAIEKYKFNKLLKYDCFSIDQIKNIMSKRKWMNKQKPFDNELIFYHIIANLTSINDVKSIYLSYDLFSTLSYNLIKYLIDVNVQVIDLENKGRYLIHFICDYDEYIYREDGNIVLDPSVRNQLIEYCLDNYLMNNCKINLNVFVIDNKNFIDYYLKNFDEYNSNKDVLSKMITMFSDNKIYKKSLMSKIKLLLIYEQRSY